MPQGKCAFCGTFVTSGGIALGKHSVACSSCASLAERWLEKHSDGAAPNAESDEQVSETPKDQPGAGRA